jgi:hypothetical protein
MKEVASMWDVLQQLWDRVKPVNCTTLSCDGFRELDGLPPEIRDGVRNSYPSNHNFAVHRDRLIPSRKLATRIAHFRQFYPQPMRSLLDLSCSKGFFVFDAARDRNCTRAMGIDLCDKTLDTCRQLRSRFVYPERVAIERLALGDLATQIDTFDGPFDTVLLINTYQYLYFGSSIAPALSRDHCEIFRQIRNVCSGRVIFHNRITFERVQKHIRNTDQAAEWGRYYTPSAIKSAASEYFRVTEKPVWGGHPVWLMDAL